MNSGQPLKIMQHRVVGLKYVMRNRQNEVMEDRMSGEPSVFLHGGTAIMSSLQRQLEGMVAGDRKQVTLQLAENGNEPDFFFDVLIDSVRLATAEELLLGYPLPPAPDCGPDCACYAEPETGSKQNHL